MRDAEFEIENKTFQQGNLERACPIVNRDPNIPKKLRIMMGGPNCLQVLMRLVQLKIDYNVVVPEV